MRRDKMTFPTALLALLLGSLIGFSCIMCLQEGFSLDCRPVMLLGGCACGAMVAVLAMLPKRSWPVCSLVGAALVAGLIWKWEELLRSVLFVCHRVTTEYALCFEGFPVVGLSEGSGLFVLVPVGFLLSWLTAWVIGREGGALLVVAACLPMLILCLIVVDLAPVLWLILLVGGLLILFISNGVRERNVAEGSWLAWWLVLPTVILVSGITVLWPPADYVRADWSDTLQKAAETTVDLEIWKETTFTTAPGWDRELKKVDLSRVGPKINTGITALEYRTNGTVRYLRGVSLGIYEDNRWEAVDTAAYQQLNLQMVPLVSASAGDHALEIRTTSRNAQLYTAYDLAAIPQAGLAVDDAYVRNMERATEYVSSYGTAQPSGHNQWAAYDRFVAEQYLQIPDELQEPLAELVAEAGLMGASVEQAADFVRNSGVYDLNTPRIPDGEDFVLYFLQESHQGYCIHFASACTMVLRAMGIPARYVTGYGVSGGGSDWNTVTEDDAHAWTEYYVNGLGWFPVDATPSAEQTSGTAVPDEELAGPAGSEGETDSEAVEQEPTDNRKPDRPAFSVKMILPQSWMWLWSVPGLVLLILVRRWAGLCYRKERCTKGSPNKRALAWWRWLVQLSKANGLPIAEDLLCLAEKARFSQHTLEDGEIEILKQAVELQIFQLKQQPTGKRLWHRYGLVLY